MVLLSDNGDYHPIVRITVPQSQINLMNRIVLSVKGVLNLRRSISSIEYRFSLSAADYDFATNSSIFDLCNESHQSFPVAIPLFVFRLIFLET